MLDAGLLLCGFRSWLVEIGSGIRRDYAAAVRVPDKRFCRLGRSQSTDLRDRRRPAIPDRQYRREPCQEQQFRRHNRGQADPAPALAGLNEYGRISHAPESFGS
jgi:hypothetical protein